MFKKNQNYSTTIPTLFKSIAVDENGINYGIKHKYKPMYGILFHPEFSNTQKNSGITIFKNFLNICNVKFKDIDYSDVKEIKHPSGPFDFLYML